MATTEPAEAPAAPAPRVVPTGPRSSLNVSADRAGNIWLYAPTQPGQMMLLGTLTGPLPVADQEAQAKEAEEAAAALEAAQNEIVEAAAALEMAKTEVEDLKKENSRLRAELKDAQEEIADLESDKKPSKKR